MLEMCEQESRHGFYGVDEDVRSELVTRVAASGVPPAKAHRMVHLSLAKCRCAGTWDWAEEAQKMWSPDVVVDRRTLMRDFHETAVILEKAILKPESRFDETLPHLPRCTAIVDGTLIPCRWRNSFESKQTPSTDSDSSVSQNDSDQDKKPFRRKTIRDRNCCRKKKGVAIIGLVVEVWCTLGGRPIWVRGPFVGSQHDGKSFQGIDCLSVETAGTIDAEESGRDNGWALRQLFPHYRTEVFLGDKGYVGCSHVLHEYKKLPGQLLSMGQRRWNRRFRCVRSRVERLFAWMDRFHILHFCDGQPQHVRDAVIIVVCVFHLIHYTKYEDVVPMAPDAVRTMFMENSRLTACRCSRGNEVVPETAPLRETIRAQWEADGLEYMPKPPAKRKR
jgi:hypothetical protein